MHYEDAKYNANMHTTNDKICIKTLKICVYMG